MTLHKKAALEVAALVHKGRQYQRKLASLTLEDTRIYWKPATGEFAVRFEPSVSQEKRAAFRKELRAAGVLPFTTENNAADERSGWVLVSGPAGYSHLPELRKYASFLDTPAKLTLAGVLLGGAGGAGVSLLRSNGRRRKSLQERLRHALAYGAVGAGIGALPGATAGVARSYQTRPYLPGGYRASQPEVNTWDALFMTERQLERASPTYRMRSEINKIQDSAFKKRASMFGELEPDGSLIQVDTFNRTIWDDTKNGWIEPDNAMLVSTALDVSRPANSPFTTPGQVATTLVNAGIGYVTAGVIGKTLGALGALSPAGEAKLRDIGMWGGMINSVGNAIR